MSLILALLPAPTAGNLKTSAPELRRNQEALALIPPVWQQLHYEIVFLSPRPGYRAMTFPSRRRIEVYARPGDSARLLAYDIAHELGHAVDASLNTPESRKQWLAARGIALSTEWFGCSRCSDYSTPAGDFAETFAFLLLGPGHFSGRIAPPPTAQQAPALRSFFQELIGAESVLK